MPLRQSRTCARCTHEGEAILFMQSLCSVRLAILFLASFAPFLHAGNIATFLLKGMYTRQHSLLALTEETSRPPSSSTTPTSLYGSKYGRDEMKPRTGIAMLNGETYDLQKNGQRRVTTAACRSNMPERIYVFRSSRTSVEVRALRVFQIG